MVGLFFPRTFWVEENFAAFDAIIDEIESRGADVIPVFSDGWFGRVKNMVLKLEQPDCPALRQALADHYGLDYDAMLQEGHYERKSY